MKHLLLGLLAVLLTAAAHAEPQEIVVTAMRSEGYGEMPAVTISKPADFLVQQIRLINDSRAPDLRKKELIATIEGMLKRAASEKNVALSYGGDGFLLPVNLTDESLEIIQDQKRSDTSSVDIFVKVSLAPGDDVKARISSLKKFIERAQLAGRTEIDPLDDIGLSVVNPEKYRHDILAKIADENARLSKAMGEKCQVKVGGLERRVKWERSEVAELTLYIPYEVEISDCIYPPG
jgi:hypothetical protein